jgi:hypothetical protein
LITRKLTKLFIKTTLCFFCDRKLIEQQKQIGYQIYRKKYTCLKCAIERNFISDQQIIKFIKSKITEKNIPNWKIEEGRVRY